MKIKDARTLDSSAQEQLRIRAVKAVLNGKKQKEVATLFGVTAQAVYLWMKRYRNGGWTSVKQKRQGRPRGGGRLAPWQCAQLVRTLADKTPEQLKLPFYLWTRKAVSELIENRYDIKYSLMQIGRYLKKWGFTPQKPVVRAYEQNPQAVMEWLKEKYPLIRRTAKRCKGEIYWGDETGMRSDHAVGTSYGRCGKTPVIRATGQRFSCNMISAITNRGTLRFMVYKKGFNTKVFISFLTRLIKDAKGKVFLIVDRHPVHRARIVHKWLEKNKAMIRMFFLPGYSPELNPDEMLNQDVKTNAVGRKKPYTQKEMMKNIRGYLWGRQEKPCIVQKYFQEKHVRYAAHEK